MSSQMSAKRYSTAFRSPIAIRQLIGGLFALVALSAVLLAGGCGEGGTDPGEIPAEITLSESTVTIFVGDSVDLVAMVLDEQGNQVPDGRSGALVIKLPLPPGTLSTLWKADQRYEDSYLRRFEGYYLTGDAGYRDDDGYLWIMSRIDDVINVAGHRLSTGAMEEILASHADVAECAVFGVEDDLKGELPLGMVVLKAGSDRDDEELRSELVALVREKIGPVAAFKLVTMVKRLPKTRSGKILRGTMKSIADGREWKMPATIDDPEILDEITQSLAGLGYPNATNP